jgi:hypothetical protein
MTTAEGINYGGRFQYIDAAQVHWPELLGKLRSAVLESYSASIKGRATPAPTTYAELCEEVSKEEACGRLKKWAESHGIGDRWLLDAAVQTLAEWSRGNDQNRWYYTPKDFDTPDFNLTIRGRWVPDLVPRWGTSWVKFQELTEQQLREELQKYRKKVAKLWGADRKTPSQQAIWTVLFQRGMSPGRIRISQTGPKHSLENIQARVHTFAKSIGLTLRAQKSGRRRKI